MIMVISTQNDKIVMDVTEIQSFLAHRYPFLLVDRVVELNVGQSIIATKNVTVNEPFFNGHFPDNPIMPGVLIIEALAQATGLLSFKTINDSPSEDILFMLVGVDKVKFKKPVIPGDQLELKAQITRQKGNIWLFETEALVAGSPVASAQIKTASTKTE